MSVDSLNKLLIEKILEVQEIFMAHFNKPDYDGRDLTRSEVEGYFKLYSYVQELRRFVVQSLNSVKLLESEKDILISKYESELLNERCNKELNLSHLVQTINTAKVTIAGLKEENRVLTERLELLKAKDLLRELWYKFLKKIRIN